MWKKIEDFMKYIDKRSQTKNKKALYKKLSHLVKKSIENILSKEIITVDEEETLRTVAGIMSREHKGALVVLRGKTPIGLIKEYDFLKLEFKADQLDRKVKEIMEHEFI